MDKIPIAERALFARVDRKLAKEGKRLRRCKTESKWYSELGALYVLDVNVNTIAAKHCSLEVLAKELGVLSEWEELEKK